MLSSALAASSSSVLRASAAMASYSRAIAVFLAVDVLGHVDRAMIVALQLDVQAQRLHFLHENLEALGHLGGGDVLALDDGFVGLTRPAVSSDFTVRISCSTFDAPYAYSAHTSISPKRWPPNCALPPSGCWVTRE